MSQSDGPHPLHESLAFLAGGGEMGGRIRSFDWSGTALGRIEGWPQSLRSALSICLNSSFPIALYWGGDLVLLYNDDWSPIPGEKHPWALGRPAHEAWSDIWDIIEPLFRRVMTAGEATRSRDQLLPMHRHGFTEECYFDYTFSPIRGESGEVEGVFNAVLETTTRVIGDRRQRTLRELAAWKASEAGSAVDACRTAAQILAGNPHDLPFALLYLLDDDGRHARLAGMTGLDRDTPVNPVGVDLADPDAPWPFRRVAEAGKSVAVHDLHGRFGPLPGGAWPEPSERAVVLPMAKPGQTQLAGFVIAGLSPRLAFNEEYRGFMDLLAGHVASLVANARAYEVERRRAEELAELDRAKTAFFSNVSHEFRTPLTLMLGPVEEILATPDRVDPENRELLTLAHRNGLRLKKLVNTLLDFSRIEAGRIRASFEPTDLSTLTAELASNFRSACERAGLGLVVDCPPLPEPAFVDHDMWEKVVLNLVSNAFKFTLEGRIEVRLRAAGGHAELTVRDTGTGIPAEEMPRLFERFYRVEGARGRTQEGSGIGLALVRELVRLHGGDVRAESVHGEGSAFTATIPLGQAHLPAERVGAPRTAASTALGAAPYVQEALRWLPDGPIPPDPGSSRPSGQDAQDVPAYASSSGPRPHVLLADDNVDMRDYVRRLLGGHCDVTAVGDGRAALEAAHTLLPDLVLTDVMMPGLDGFGLLRGLRSDPRTREVPVLLLSARAGEEARVEGMQAGADDYLTKPFGAKELLARVEAHLALARLRREAAAALRASERRFQAFMDHSPATAFIKDEEGRYVFVNRMLERHFGRPLSDWVGKTDFDLFPADEAEQYWRNDRGILESGAARQFSEVATEADGRHDYLVVKFPMHDDAGRRLLAGMALDVTEQRRAEREAARHAERQRLLWETATVLLSAGEPDAMMRGLFDKLAPHFDLDAYFNFMVDESGEALRLVSCLGIPDEEARKIARLDFGQAICGTVALHRRPITATNIQQSDDPKVQLVRGLGIRAYACNPLEAGGSLLGTLSFASSRRDEFDADEVEFLRTVAHYVAFAYDRVRLVRTLQEDDRRKDEFLATLAHELRNPLAPIRNGLQIMKMAAGDPQAIDEARSLMERQVTHMVRLIDDLMDVSRITRGKLDLRKERVELAAVIRAAVDTSRPLIEGSDHELTLTIPARPIYVDADPTRLAQVFSNLLNNAAKYTEPGGDIALIAERQGSDVVVTVRDNGVGIPPEMLPHVFEMFTQVDRSLERSQGGLGIGLSLVRGMVEMHRGSVEARSGGQGRGSEFVVRLPIVVSPTLRTPTGVDKAAGPGPASSRRILVVDDNHDSARTLARLLTLMGHEARTAHDGGEAVAAAEQYRPDLMLLDIGLPVLNGYEVARAIRQTPWGGDVLIVALTGWGQEGDRRRSKEAGIDRHLVKPVDPSALETLLSESRPGSDAASVSADS